MIFNSIFRHHCVIPCLRRILKNGCIRLNKSAISRKSSSFYPKWYGIDRYDRIQVRLASVPYLDLLNKEVDQVHKDLCYESDERLQLALDWMSKVFDYNVRNGKKNCAISLLKAYCTYGFSLEDEKWRQWDLEGWKAAAKLGWYIELFQACFFLLDDLVENAEVRDGEECWYKKPDIGMCVINDSLLLQCGIYKLLEMHFDGYKCYMDLLHEFLEATNQKVYGECIDMMSNPMKKPRFEAFNFENYLSIVEFKTANYKYRLPLHLAMHLAGGYLKEDFDFTRDVCLKLGLYTRSHEDHLDCFGDSESLGKANVDIREGKCTWHSIKFLEDASESKKKEFMEYYGVDDKEAVDKVLKLYREENLPEKYEEYSTKLFKETEELIESKNDFRGALFYHFFDSIRKTEN